MGASYLIANFGGPRNLKEIPVFLEELLTDQDVVRTKMPSFLHRLIFRRAAKKRAVKITKDYEEIGGRSPIYNDTEAVAEKIRTSLGMPVLTFHRYLPSTHADFVKAIQELRTEEIRVFPMFPQFTYATSGSIARWFDSYLPQTIVSKMRWIKSYSSHPSFIYAHQTAIRHFLEKEQLEEKDTVLLFSAHGIPQEFVEQGDLYEDECLLSFKHVMAEFPKIFGRICYQSKFGPGEWLKPYTIDVCKEVKRWHQGRKNIVFVPISFTSDHIETLFEVENEYMTVIRAAGLNAYRVPALTLQSEWIKAILSILKESNLCNNQMLIRKK